MKKTDTSIRISQATKVLLDAAHKALKRKTGVEPKSQDQLVRVALREYIHQLSITPADQIAQ